MIYLWILCSVHTLWYLWGTVPVQLLWKLILRSDVCPEAVSLVIACISTTFLIVLRACKNDFLSPLLLRHHQTPDAPGCTQLGGGEGAFLEYIMHENKRIEQRLWNRSILRIGLNEPLPRQRRRIGGLGESGLPTGTSALAVGSSGGWVLSILFLVGLV